MVVGKVVSSIISTRKYRELQGLKFLLIEPYYGKKGEYFVAADRIGAGNGELVLVSFGDNTQYGLDNNAPVDALVVGIIDSEPSV